MSALRIVDASGVHLDRWDDAVERSVNGTLFHLRRFLAYHADRYAGAERLLVVLDGDSLVGQLPVAVVGEHLRSPYGGSYGGLVLQRYPTFSQASRLVQALVAWMRAEGVTRATITPPIGACASYPLDVLHFAFLNGGFRSVNRDVSSLAALDPAAPVESTVASRARNSARRAERVGVTVRHRAAIDDFWSVLESTFERHGAAPTHTHAEFRQLAETLPERVYADVAYHDGAPVAGVGYFAINSRVNSSFYFGQHSDRRELNGLTMCILEGLERSRREGFAWFDFGTSTAAMAPRENVFRFKEQFSLVGQFRETFEWEAP